jgi:hypothetical protein
LIPLPPFPRYDTAQRPCSRVNTSSRRQQPQDGR